MFSICLSVQGGYPMASGSRSFPWSLVPGPFWGDTPVSGFRSSRGDWVPLVLPQVLPGVAPQSGYRTGVYSPQIVHAIASCSHTGGLSCIISFHFLGTVYSIAMCRGLCNCNCLYCLHSQPTCHTHYWKTWLFTGNYKTSLLIMSIKLPFTLTGSAKASAKGKC